MAVESTSVSRTTNPTACASASADSLPSLYMLSARFQDRCRRGLTIPRAKLHGRIDIFCSRIAPLDHPYSFHYTHGRNISLLLRAVWAGPEQTHAYRAPGDD